MADQNTPGVVPNAGISPEAHEAAIAKAGADATAAANERMAAVMGADGVKGDGKRMAAALDLAIKSPGMSAGDVAAFVAGNVGNTKPDAATYEQERLAAAGLTETSKNSSAGKAEKAKAGWAKAFSRIG